MSVKFTIEKKFVVNGKEYRSVEEMPPHIREAFQKAARSAGEAGEGSLRAAAVAGKINFNGVEYENRDAMPPDIRQLYENIMGMVDRHGGSAAARGELGLEVSVGSRKARRLQLGGALRPTTPTSLLSPGALLVRAALLLLLFLAVFYLAR